MFSRVFTKRGFSRIPCRDLHETRMFADFNETRILAATPDFHGTRILADDTDFKRDADCRGYARFHGTRTLADDTEFNGNADSRGSGKTRITRIG